MRLFTTLITTKERITTHLLPKSSMSQNIPIEVI